MAKSPEVNPMRYLDANVFCLAALYSGEKADRARSLLQSVIQGKTPAITAALTLDEVAWTIAKHEGRDAGIRQATRLLGMPNLTILDVKARHLASAFDLMADHSKLHPRDAIHAAVTMEAGVYAIHSDDDDFDAIPQLNRSPL